ncbi:MAG: hypothetical protein JSW12_15895 [Deltaproteobacteria bacterium]|nr:MAG: hypothetical protein JSW12_15895 [Deltaproteobacteria bacterium]
MTKGHTQEGMWGSERAVEAYPYFSEKDPGQVCELAKLFHRLFKELVDGQGRLRWLFKEMYDFSQVFTTCLF